MADCLRESSTRVVAVGEVLWDIFEQSKRLGGAPLIFSAHATRLGCEPRLISAIGNDRADVVREVADPVGAGDAFAAAFLHGLSSGWPVGKIAQFANRVGALVASRQGAIPDWTLEAALKL